MWYTNKFIEDQKQMVYDGTTLLVKAEYIGSFTARPNLFCKSYVGCGCQDVLKWKRIPMELEGMHFKIGYKLIKKSVRNYFAFWLYLPIPFHLGGLMEGQNRVHLCV
jgi:hypothetical protein